MTTSGTYTITVEETFNATHAVQLPDGQWEPVHGHDWRVCAVFTRDRLDDRGMVVDFVAARETLRAVLSHFAHVHLNDHAWFCGCSPTAEAVARVIFEQVRERDLPQLCRIDVAEAPGCGASFELRRAGDGVQRPCPD